MNFVAADIGKVFMYYGPAQLFTGQYAFFVCPSTHPHSSQQHTICNHVDVSVSLHLLLLLHSELQFHI